MSIVLANPIFFIRYPAGIPSICRSLMLVPLLQLLVPILEPAEPIPAKSPNVRRDPRTVYQPQCFRRFGYLAHSTTLFLAHALRS
jgi:hypothetical protein